MDYVIIELTPTRLCNVALVRRYGQLIMPCREQFEASKACCPFFARPDRNIVLNYTVIF